MKVSKIISMTSCALLLPLCSTANALAWLPGHFLAGPEIGYIVRSTRLYGHQFAIENIPVPGAQNEHFTNHGTIYGALVGYQVLMCRNFLMGLEANFDLGRYEQVENFSIPLLLTPTASMNMIYYRESNYGVSARIGYKVKPCFLPYVRIGAQGGEDHLLINYTGLPSLPNWDSFENKQTSWSWLVGIGLEFPLFSKQSSIRLEYDYVPARHYSTHDLIPPITGEYHYGPHSYITKLQWVWNFI